MPSSHRHQIPQPRRASTHLPLIDTPPPRDRPKVIHQTPQPHRTSSVSSTSSAASSRSSSSTSSRETLQIHQVEYSAYYPTPSTLRDHGMTLQIRKKRPQHETLFRCKYCTGHDKAALWEGRDALMQHMDRRHGRSIHVVEVLQEHY